MEDEQIEKEVKIVANRLVETFGDIYDLMRAYKKDRIAVNTEFTFVVDYLSKDGEISEETAQNIILEEDETYKDFLLNCLDVTYNISEGIFV